MKNRSKMTNLLRRSWGIIFIALLFSSSAILAQNDDDKGNDKKKARISLNYTNTNNIGPRLIATVKSKVDKSYENIPNVKVNFYLDEAEEDTKLGEVLTNNKGEAVFIPPETKHGDTQYLYLATIENDVAYEDNEAELEVEKSFMELNFEVEDSVKKVQLFVGMPDSTGNIIPVEEVEARIFVKRLFGLLPIMAETEMTDEEGFINIDFPDDIPGDENGNISIVAQVADHETFGTLKVVKAVEWGIPLKPDDKMIKRELWSARSNAPISMIIIINTMMLGVWGVIVYVMFQLLRIYKIGKEKIVD